MEDLVKRIKDGGLKIFVGNTHIYQLTFRLKKREEFKEEVYKYKLLHTEEKSLKVGTEFDRISFYKTVLAENVGWSFADFNKNNGWLAL